MVCQSLALGQAARLLARDVDSFEEEGREAARGLPQGFQNEPVAFHKSVDLVLEAVASEKREEHLFAQAPQIVPRHARHEMMGDLELQTPVEPVNVGAAGVVRGSLKLVLEPGLAAERRSLDDWHREV